MESQTASTGAGGAAPGAQQGILVRYWAGARASVGLAEELVPVEPPVTVTALRELVAGRHPAAARVLAICSLLVDEQPLGTADASDVLVESGQTVEFLPPSAGG